jgi:hypothetical protein
VKQGVGRLFLTFERSKGNLEECSKKEKNVFFCALKLAQRKKYYFILEP